MSLGGSSNNISINKETLNKKDDQHLNALNEEEDQKGSGEAEADSELNYLFKGDYFGEDAILQNSRFTFTACGAVQCVCIPAEAFSKHILTKTVVQDILVHSMASQGGMGARHPSSVNLLKNGPQASIKSGNSFTSRSSSQNALLLPGLAHSATPSNISIFKTLEYRGDLGKGAFGVVRLLEDKTSKNLVALKSLNRKLFTDSDTKKVTHAVRTAVQEKTILSITRFLSFFF